jgi:uroporphyrin-3 C-methyltransferase
MMGFGYYQLAHVNFTLASMITQAQTQARDANHNVAALEKTVADLSASARKSEELSGKQEQMIADWQAAQKGDLDKWYVAEAQYLVRLANDHLQFTHDVNMAMTLLQRAEQALQTMQTASTLEIRKSIASDIANLQATPNVDITDLYLHLTALNNQINQLPLPESPLQADKQQPVAAIDPNLSWWQAGFARTMQMMHQIVIVHRYDNNAMPLVLPEEKTFLYQNLHAQLENAIWGVLHRKPEIYEEGVTRTVSWIKQYFVQDAPATKSMLENLQELQKIDIKPPVANLSATLQLFDTYFAQPQQAKSA